MTVITFSSASPAHPHLRRFDLSRDLNPVADLIEKCFIDTLDRDGRRYIRQMRSAARHRHLLRWTAGVADRAMGPFSGFVWEQDGQVVGNLSQIPMPAPGKKIYLIANVAVHPEYRRRGIARELTQAALEFSTQRKAHATWLHVRDDNPAAIALYRSMDFVERTRRTTWKSLRPLGNLPTPAGVAVVPRRKEHWPLQLTWLNQVHPPELAWYLPINVKAFRPGLPGMLTRFFSETSIRQWSALRAARLLGVLVWQRTAASADRLWLAAPPQHESEAIQALIPFAGRHLSRHKAFNLEYPAGSAVNALTEAGFTPYQTLIWMEHTP